MSRTNRTDRTKSTAFPAALLHPQRSASAGAALAAILATALGTVLGTALASPRDALEVRSDEVALLRARAAEAVEELERARSGLEASLDVDPALVYLIPLPDAGTDGGLGFEYDVTGSVRYLYDRAAMLDAERDLLQARTRVEDAVRGDVENALVLLADAARAEIALIEAGADLEAAHATLAAREADGSSPVLVDEARLEVRMREGDLAAAEAGLADLLARLDAFGLPPSSVEEITGTRFVLPAPTGEGGPVAPDMALRRFDVRIARAEAAEAGAFEVLRELELSAIYQDDGRLARVSGLLDRGRPGIEVAGELDDSNRTDGFVVRLGAELHVSTATTDAIGDAGRAVEEAERELAAVEAEVAADVARLRREIARDLEILELDLADLAVEEVRAEELADVLATLPARIEALQADVATTRERRDDAEGDARRELDAEVRGLEAELRAAERALIDAERERERRLDGILQLRDRALRDWIAYVRDVTDLLDATGARWALSGNGG